MATNKEHYEAGGGDAEFEKLRANSGYRFRSDAYIRNLVEQKGKRALAGPRRDAARDLSDEEAFKAGGGNAALENLKNSQQYRYRNDDYLRGIVSQRGRRAVAEGPADNAPKPDKKVEDLKITSDSSVEDKQAAANAARRAGQLSNIPAGTPVDTTEPETPGAGDTTPAETPPVPASEVVKPPSQRELLIKEAKTKYKDSPFKQWAHANQKLAKALKPGQVGYAQVQEYFKEQGKNGKLKVKPEEKPFIKSNASQLQMKPGATDLPGYFTSSSPVV